MELSLSKTSYCSFESISSSELNLISGFLFNSFEIEIFYKFDWIIRTKRRARARNQWIKFIYINKSQKQKINRWVD